MSWKEILSTINKSFGSLPEEQKKEAFLQVVEVIENSNRFQNAKNYWDSLDEEHKLRYYTDWWGSLKFLTTWPLTPRITKQWLKIDMKDNIYTVMSPVMRLLVSFWLLDKPNELSYDDLIKNIESDAKTLENYIKILKIVSVFYPELNELLTILEYLEPYAKWYEENWTQIVQERIRDKQEKDTRDWLADTLSQWDENVYTEKKAA